MEGGRAGADDVFMNEGCDGSNLTHLAVLAGESKAESKAESNTESKAESKTESKTAATKKSSPSPSKKTVSFFTAEQAVEEEVRECAAAEASCTAAFNPSVLLNAASPSLPASVCGADDDCGYSAAAAAAGDDGPAAAAAADGSAAAGGGGDLPSTSEAKNITKMIKTFGANIRERMRAAAAAAAADPAAAADNCCNEETHCLMEWLQHTMVGSSIERCSTEAVRVGSHSHSDAVYSDDDAKAAAKAAAEPGIILAPTPTVTFELRG
jgi:hypothetical protein